MRFPLCLLAGLALLTASCGRSEMGASDSMATGGTGAGRGQGGTGGSVTGTGGRVTGTGGTVNPRWGTVFDGATDGRTPAECSDLADAITGNFGPGQSVVIMRFDYLTHAPRGYRQYRYYGDCAPYSEAEARTCAKSDSSLQLPFDPTAQGACLTDRSMDIGPWVFHQAPPDAGGVVLVDHGVGLVFAASLALEGGGEIFVPTTWSTPDVGVGCIATGGTVPSQAYDLRTGGKLPAAEARTIAALAQRSVLPGIWDVWGGYSWVPLVMLYPRTTADFDPQTAEYIVAILGNTAGN